MKKKSTRCIVSLSIGLLNFNTLSSCGNAKQALAMARKENSAHYDVESSSVQLVSSPDNAQSVFEPYNRGLKWIISKPAHICIATILLFTGGLCYFFYGTGASTNEPLSSPNNPKQLGGPLQVSPISNHSDQVISETTGRPINMSNTESQFIEKAITEPTSLKDLDYIPDYVFLDLEKHDYSIKSLDHWIKKGLNVNGSIPGPCEHYFLCYESLLDFAVNHHKPDLIKHLIQNGVNVNAKINHGISNILIIAMRKGWGDIFELLLKNGADTNIETFSGSTPLVVAVKERNKEYVKLLLDHGANPYYKNIKGHTVFDEFNDYASKKPADYRTLQHLLDFIKSYANNKK